MHVSIKWLIFAANFQTAMSKRLSTIIAFLGHYKYLITIVVGVAYVGFFDDNSFMQRIKYDIQISQLKDEIQKYNEENQTDNKELNSIKHNPRAIEKIARERYFMKTDDEDIFVLSTDKPANSNNDKIGNDETTK